MIPSARHKIFLSYEPTIFEPYNPETSKAGYADKGYFIVAPEMQLDIDGKPVLQIPEHFIRGIYTNVDLTDWK